MQLFKMINWQLQVEDSAWGLEPFKKILSKDKSKDKGQALKEMLFIYYFSDLHSDYIQIVNEEERIVKIKKDIPLPDKWEPDAVVKAGIDFYRESSITIIGGLYLSATKAVAAVRDYLENSDYLLKERDSQGKPVTKIGDITKALKDVKAIMQDLKAAEKEVIKEQKETEGRSKGSRSFNPLEDGVGDL